MHTLTFLLPLLITADANINQPTVIVVLGAAGNVEYAETFSTWGNRWEMAAQKANAKFVKIGFSQQSSKDEEAPDRDRLKQTLAELNMSSSGPVWLVFIGHGTFDGKRAKFNLQGPDVTATELAQWIQNIERPLAIINCASSSGPFVNRLSGANRVIVTATKSGSEQNYSRFGEHLSSAIADPAADLDKDGQTSLLEAFLKASAGVKEFYKQESRLATEHALIDDNGDGLGTPADWFQGYRAIRQGKDGALPDGNRANQFVLIPGTDDQKLTGELRKSRDDLELQIAQLRSQKSKLSQEDYYRKLEPLLLELAQLYRTAEAAKSD